ncbi:MipA/OmpV family protein [Aquabacterium sp. J223]|uniref:MipA/OmpV family protein n=1 Tax=Aquabacterium sp. J223 TaxID=2898431 RepID=UPI0021AE2D0A|nr:MipA/OmpV family protein [Aquabacterium sp. J223]
MLPDYPGADRSRVRGLVLPVLLYRGPVWRVDGEGVRSRLVAQPDWTLDLSASGAFRSRDNPAREGMPPLDWLVGLGPQLVWHGWREAPGRPTLHLKARALLSTDGRDWHGRGHVLEPEVRWHWTAPLPGGPGRLSFGVQPTWASEALHRYFYEVAPSQATGRRPAWDARAGYFGTEVKLTLGRRESQALSWFVTARALSLHGAANEGSPLAKEGLNWTVGLGLVWTPWRSAETVPAR